MISKAWSPFVRYGAQNIEMYYNSIFLIEETDNDSNLLEWLQIQLETIENEKKISKKHLGRRMNNKFDLKNSHGDHLRI